MTEQIRDPNGYQSCPCSRSSFDPVQGIAEAFGDPVLEVVGKGRVPLAQTIQSRAGEQTGQGIFGGIAGKEGLGVVLRAAASGEQVALGELTDQLAALVTQIEDTAAHDVQIGPVRVVRRKGGAAAEITHRESAGQLPEHSSGSRSKG